MEPQGRNLLSAEDVFAPRHEEVIMERWAKNGQPGVVLVRFMSAGEVADFIDQETSKERNLAMVRLIGTLLVDADGKPLLTEDQVAKFRNVDFVGFTDLQAKVVEMNELGGDDDEDDESEEIKRIELLTAARLADVDDEQFAIMWAALKPAVKTEEGKE